VHAHTLKAVNSGEAGVCLENKERAMAKIVRIMSDNQYRMTDEQMHQFDLIDDDLEDALNNEDDAKFRAALQRLTDYIHSTGQVVPIEELVESDVIVPAVDMSLAEAKQHFTPYNETPREGEETPTQGD